MGEKVNDQEFQAVLALPAQRRYRYFVKRVAARGELWSIHGDDGWVIAADDEEHPHLPVWSDRRFAEACIEGPWSDGQARSIDVDEWTEAWIPQLLRDEIRIAVFQTPSDEGVSVLPELFKLDLEAELNLLGGPG
jgi:hypothetical protein